MSRYIINTRAFKIAMTVAGFDSFAALGRACKLSDRTVSAIAHGKIPTYPTMLKLAKALNLAPEQAGSIFFHDNLRNT